MTSQVQRLSKLGLINPPGFLAANIHYEVVMGSVAYGVSTDMSDMDVYGFCIPPKDVVFPHLAGEIEGFGRQKKRFEQYQQAHVRVEDEGKEFDFTIFNIVKYFSLCMENNPNMVDSLFVPLNLVLHATRVGQMVRENRRLFLHKGSWQKFKGYAYSKLSSVNKPKHDSKRRALVEKYGYDVKDAYHVVRLLDEVEQILATGYLDLQRAKEVMRAVRNGEWSYNRVIHHFRQKESQLEELYHTSTLPWVPDEDAIKGLLLACLEEHYGSLAAVVAQPGREKRALEKILKLAQTALYGAG